MTRDIQQAYDEIMDLPPMFRREIVVGFLRENLAEEEARRLYFRKTKGDFLERLYADGYVTPEEILEKIGKERVRRYFHLIGSAS